MDSIMSTLAKSHSTSVMLGTSLLASLTSPFQRYSQNQPDIWSKDFLPSSVRDPDPLVDLVGVYLEFALFFLVVLVLFRHLVAHPFARVALPSDKRDVQSVSKFGDSACECANYMVFTFIGLSVSLTSSWTWPSSNWWSGYADGSHDLMRSDLRCWYIMDASRYTALLFSILFLEHGRKDFKEMLIHHIVTIVITLVSYHYDFTRVGAIVKLVMDPADVPLHLAKLCLYIGGTNKKGVAVFWSNRFFEVFAVVFFVTRIILFGYVVWSAGIESSSYLVMPPAGWGCVVLLLILLCLQMFWMSLIVKMALKLSKGDELEDIRSDSEGEGDKKEAPITRKKKKKQ
ncbi:hypothetical protein TrVE_jg9668 [Triparma verrucosa]|uniref:TLC domain-containing protein n=1 Tax=Triparma verrucosa TaxID=1606542 RepID=A0A9W7BME1_9STRA|nr:hypothetical protein TrVE_jg9668 [Triparma verrucosa]